MCKWYLNTVQAMAYPGDMPRDTLTREQIVRAAIELMDAEGVEGLSMRRLGKRLGSAATAVFAFVLGTALGEVAEATRRTRLRHDGVSEEERLRDTMARVSEVAMR